MRYKLFGKSGLRVSELSLGTMTFGTDWGWGAPLAECKKMFDHFAEAGGNFIDTANRYTEGTAERFVGEFIAADRNRFVLATKYSLKTRTDDPNFAGNHRKNMMQALHGSLKRLRTEYIDVYWVHAWDFVTPVEEVLRGLDDIVSAGKVHYIGISDTPAWVVSQANTMAELRGWSQFVGLQIQYSLIERSAERDLLPMARAFDIAVTPWSVLGSGVLSGKFNIDPATAGRAATNKRTTEKNLAIAREVIAVAEEIGCDPAHVAINWVRAQPGVIVPIIGARTFDQFEANMRCLEFTLEPAHIERLNAASDILLGFPHSFLQSDGIRDLTFAGYYSRIDRHR